MLGNPLTEVSRIERIRKIYKERGRRWNPKGFKGRLGIILVSTSLVLPLIETCISILIPRNRDTYRNH